MITSAPDLMRYKVVLVPSADIQPSPENIDIYGEVDFDQPMKDLVASIEANMDMSLFRKVAAQEDVDIEELHQIKQQIAGELKF